MYGEESNHYIVTEQDKFIWYSQSGEEQYFDLSKDPREQHNAVCDAEYQERVQKMRGWMIEALEGREEGFVEQGRLRTGADDRMSEKFVGKWIKGAKDKSFI